MDINKESIETNEVTINEDFLSFEIRSSEDRLKEIMEGFNEDLTKEVESSDSLKYTPEKKTKKKRSVLLW